MKVVSFIAMILIPLVCFAAGRIQNEDVKSLTEITAAGGTAANLINDTKIYVTANGINQQLSAAITSGLVGGGGGGSLQWIEGPNAPLTTIDSTNNRVFQFQSGQGQKLYALIKVPHQYGGNQIKMYLSFYSPDTSGNVLLQTQSTLVRPNSDTFNISTNQRTSTNTAVTLGTANTVFPVVIDLTDSTGKINGVQVAADNLIYVALTRASDTSVSDVSVPVYGAEVTTH